MKKDIVKVSWSGGKDSSCAAHLRLSQGDECIIVCYIPMFTDKIPLLLKNHYEFILHTADKFRQMGARVFLLHGETYWDFVHRRRVKGQRKGIPFGFPPFIRQNCSFKTYSKTKVLSDVDKEKQLLYDYEDIGIAIDEKHRLNQLDERKRSILVERGFTEQMAADYCIKNGIYSPHYKEFKRDGCVLCPQAPPSLRVKWFQENPEAFYMVLQLQDFVKKEIPGQYPLREKSWFIEEDLQIGLFDKPGETRYLIN